MLTSEKRSCVDCNETKRIAYKKLCFKCCWKQDSERRIAKVLATFVAASSYNQYIFDCFMRYTNDYAFTLNRAQQTEELAKLLTTAPLQTIATWADIYQLKDKHPNSFSKSASTYFGHPLHKVGRMLEALGVIASRSETTELQIENQLKKIDPSDREHVHRFISKIRNRTCLETTICKNIISIAALSAWATSKKKTLLTITEQDYTAYFATLREKYKQSHIKSRHCHVARFYRWCTCEHLLKKDHTNAIKTPRRIKRHLVCSGEDVKKISRFIRSKSSDAEHALILALILTCGLTCDEMRHAQIEFTADSFRILLALKKITYQKRVVRPQIINLPLHSDWFKVLTDRYLLYWKKQFDLAKHPTPKQFLLLPRCNQSSRPLCNASMSVRIAQATISATGRAIPAAVLRQTCGALHVKHNDASMLSTLGWAKYTTFSYVWTPKAIF